MYIKFANCYENLHLYEDALDICNKGLGVDYTDKELLYIKAKVLSNLFKFKQSIAIFKEMGDNEKEVK